MMNPLFLIADKFATQENNHPSVLLVAYLYQFDEKRLYGARLKDIETKDNIQQTS